MEADLRKSYIVFFIILHKVMKLHSVFDHFTRSYEVTKS